MKNTLKTDRTLLFLQACRNEMAGVEKAYAGYFHNSTQSNIYGYPVYTRNNLLYAKDADKVAGFAGEYDLQKALKDKNIRDIANANVYNLDEKSLRRLDAWSEVGANIAAGWAGHKIAKGALDKPPVIPKEANANEVVPIVGKTEGYNATKVNLYNLEIETSKQNKHLENTNEYKVSLANG